MALLKGRKEMMFLFLFLVIAGGILLMSTASVSAATSVGTNVTTGGNVAVTGTLQVTDTVTTYGAVTLGDAYADAITVNGRVASSLFTSSTLQVTGAVTTYGAVTLGDAVNDAITVNGRLGTLTISDGSTATSSITYNTIKSGVLTGTYDVGKFYVDSSGGIFTSSSVRVFGNVTSTSHIYPASNNGVDLGAFDYAFRNVYVSGTLYAGGLSLLGSERLVVTNVSSTNITAGGYLTTDGATTLNGAVTLGNAANDGITVNGRLGTLTISDGSTATTTFTYNTIKSGVLTGTYDVGKFYVDSSGNVSASGTLIVDTDSLFVDATNNKVGIVSSTASAQLSVGSGATATSTMSFGALCFRAYSQSGATDQEVYYYPCVGAACPTVAMAAAGWATSTVSCY